MKSLFVNGTYRGEGRWVDQKAEGRYTALYTISDGEGEVRVHRAERTFLGERQGIRCRHLRLLRELWLHR